MTTTRLERRRDNATRDNTTQHTTQTQRSSAAPSADLSAVRRERRCLPWWIPWVFFSLLSPSFSWLLALSLSWLIFPVELRSIGMGRQFLAESFGNTLSHSMRLVLAVRML
eukprot:scaffold66567_cov42-Attheya_sp.AAC.1